MQGGIQALNRKSNSYVVPTEREHYLKPKAYQTMRKRDEHYPSASYGQAGMSGILKQSNLELAHSAERLNRQASKNFKIMNDSARSLKTDGSLVNFDQSSNQKSKKNLRQNPSIQNILSGSAV